jgi:adenylylsulfate reductase subunit A
LIRIGVLPPKHGLSAQGHRRRRHAIPFCLSEKGPLANGETYKTIFAEAAKKALGIDSIFERVFIVKLLLDAKEPNRIAGAVGFSVREDKIYVATAWAASKLRLGGGRAQRTRCAVRRQARSARRAHRSYGWQT